MGHCSTDIFGPVEENNDEKIEETEEEPEEEEEEEQDSSSSEEGGEADDDEPDLWKPLRRKVEQDIKEPYMKLVQLVLDKEKSQT